MKKLFLLFTFLCCAVVASARVWHVTTTGTGTDGSVWATAVSLQYALGNAAANDEIWVAAGTYKPTSGTDRTISFNIPSNVKVYGGFAGTETAFSQRPATIIGGGINATILSGDIGTTGNNADNTRNIVNLDNGNVNTELNGFIIEDANFPDGTRGAITATDGGGWVRNCVLRNNNGYAFAAFHYKLGSAGGFENCFIVDNTSPYSAAGIETSIIQVNNCVFANNTTTNEASDLQFINSYSAAINCTFYGTSTGGTCAILVQTPSGIPSLSNCILWTGQTNSFELRSGINFSTNYCVVKSGKTGAGTWLGNNTITTNPLFVNENDIDGADNLYGTADDGLQILYPSPARNAGINNALTTDIVGTTRPTATTTDIGAYENPTTATITPTVSIAITIGSNPVCAGGSLTFTATPTNGGNNPTYQWTKNNVNISGATNAIYTGTAGTDFVNADEIRCVLTSNDPNANPLTANSTGITMNIGSPITLSTVSNQTICLGQAATFSTIANEAGAASAAVSVGIPDNDPTGVLIPLTITGTGNIATNTTIEARLSINHIWDEDLDLYLIGPGNCGAMELSTDNGADGDNYINTIFLTGAPISITAGSAPFTGTFAPEKDHTLPATGATGLPASALVGCPIAGVWQVRVIDDDPTFLGNVYNVYLTITDNKGTVTHSISSGQANAGLPVTPVTSGNLNRQATYTVTPTAASTYTYTLAAQQNGCAASTNVNITVSSPTTRIYVKSNATGANNGTSWADAYTDLQSALSTTCLATNAEIWVAAGTYKPTSGTDRTISFIIPSNVKVYGGFAGTETALSQRPTNVMGVGINATILSGDIGTVVDNADNTYNIVKMEGNINTLLDGFIVEEANFISDDRGAINAKANGGGNLNNLIIRNNTGYAFSAFQYTGGAVGSINNCFIINNTSPFSAAGIDNGSNVPISNCVFANNITTNEATDLQLLNTTSIITNCTFYGTSNNGTATIRVNVNATPTLRNCIFWGGNTHSFDVQTGSTLTASYCNVGGTTTGGGTLHNTNSIASNPLFVNTNDLDGADNLYGTADDGLVLQAGSPSINKGTNAGAPPTDIVGTARPTDVNTDMGAYENPTITSVTPSISISVNNNPTCASTNVTFTATPTNGGNNPTYQWTKNNVNISGATNAIYTCIAGTDFVNADEIRCVLTSNDPNANLLTATSTAIVMTVTASTTRLYVKVNAGGANNGTSWNDAFTNLQSALNYACLAPNAEIWVAAGIYYPTSGTDRSISFNIPNGVSVYGGFVGNEANLNERPVQRVGGNENTYFSGDINTHGNATDNTYRVVVFAGINSPTRLDGVSVIYGNANGPTSQQKEGGGVRVEDNGNNVSITHCTIAQNKAQLTAGISASSTTSLLVDKCLIRSNSSENGTGGLSLGGSNSTVSNNVFMSNENLQGSGGALTFENSNNNSNVINCLFVNNLGAFTGAVFTEEGTGHLLLNCTFLNNSTWSNLAADPDHIYSDETGTIELKNCIVVTTLSTIHPAISSLNNTITASYSNIQGGFAGTGNINANPLFVNRDDPDGPDNRWATADDGFNLFGCSPSKNTGTNTNAPTNDILGTARPQESTVDMGAFETTLTNPVVSRFYVKANAGGANNGTSWNDAFTDLQSALNYPCFAPNAEIWVANGTYKPTSGSDRSISFIIPSGVKLYGGFVGTETAVSQRVLPSAGAGGSTILSGDLVGNDATTFANRTDNALHVVIFRNVTSATRLDGVVIIGGFANQNTEILGWATPPFVNSKGAGILNLEGASNVTIAYCTLTDNAADTDGGGMLSTALSDGSGSSSLPVVTHSIISHNRASLGGGIAVINYGGKAPFGVLGITLTNTQFSNNQANDSGGGLFVQPVYGSATVVVEGGLFSSNNATGSGGGMYLRALADAAIPATIACSINNTTFNGNQIGNTAGNSGAGIGGVFSTNTSSTVTIANSLITSNIAQSSSSRGGGIGFQTSPQTANSSASLQFTMTNSTLSNNQASFGGGGLLGTTFGGATPFTSTITSSFTNCTINNNTATGRGGGLVLRSFGNLTGTFTRCIFSQNTADNGGAVDLAGETSGATVGTLTGEINECLFINNTATTRGGAIRYDDGAGTATWAFRNCTATGNTAGQYGFFNIENWNSGQTAPIFRNSIAYGNGANSISLNGGTISVAKSLIEGSGGSSNWNAAFGTDNGGNIDANPAFVNTADPDGTDNLWRTVDDGLQLASNSPAINAGNNTNVSATDITGAGRIQQTTVDMGAYEATCTPVTPAVAIAVTNGSNPSCAGTSVTFTATPTHGGSMPGYQWKRNGNNIGGANGVTFTGVAGTDFVNGDQIACLLTSNDPCVSAPNATSTAITMSVNSLASRLYVKATASGANNGTSWNDAFTNLQSALSYACLAPNAEIWVAAGTYKPTNSTDRNASFFLPSGIRLYGGFVGTESNLNQRPTHVIGGGANATILSGNIGDTGIDTDNSYNVVAAFETAAGTLINGFIIEKGYANVSNSVLVNDIYKPSNAGAGILLADKSFNAHPTHLEVRHCWIRDNKSISNGTAMRFYAAALTSDYNVSVKACVFTDNEGLQGSSAGLSFDGSNGKVNVVVENSLFLRQTSSNYSIFNINDGGNNTGMTVKFFNNTFTNNTSGNAYNALGIINCYQATTNIRFSNNIMWGNNYDQMYNNIQMIRNNSNNASITVTNNLIEDGYTGGGTVANNLDTNPFFVNASDPDGTDNLWGTSDDGLALQASSPARNTGINSDAPATDIVGTTRPVDGIVDMGAYEATCTPLTPSVTIAITTGTNPTYAGNSITFTATPTNGGGNPSYVWKKNNGIITGVMGNTYATTTLANGDKIKVEMTSNEPCASPTMATSNEITICILPAASSVTGGGTYCTGGTGVTVGLSNSETGVSYQLRKDNVDDGIVVAGTGAAISFGIKTAIGTYTAVATRTSGGCTNNMIGSVSISVDQASVGGSVSSAQTICAGTSPADLALSNQIGNVVKWQKSNSLNFNTFTDISNTSTALTSATIGNLTMDTYFRAVVKSGVCAEVNSVPATIRVNTKPAISLNVNGQTLNEGNSQTLCDTDANPVNTLQFTVAGACISGLPVWRTQIGNGSWSDWSTTAPNSQMSNNTDYRYQAACDGACSSTFTQPITLRLIAQPTDLSLSGGGISFCGTPLSIVVESSQAGVSYQLKRNNVNLGNPLEGTGLPLAFSGLTQVGTYSVVATTAVGNCSRTLSDQITIQNRNAPTAYNLTGGGASCSGTPVSINLSNSQIGVLYQLKRANNPVGSPVPGTGNALSFPLKTPPVTTPPLP